jgi:hypothetical protein
MLPVREGILLTCLAYQKMCFNGSLGNADHLLAAFAGTLALALLPVDALVALIRDVGFGTVGALFSSFLFGSFD